MFAAAVSVLVSDLSADEAVVAASDTSEDAAVAADVSAEDALEEASSPATISAFAISLFASSVISISLLPSVALIDAPSQPTSDNNIADAKRAAFVVRLFIVFLRFILVI